MHMILEEERRHEEEYHTIETFCNSFTEAALYWLVKWRIQPLLLIAMDLEMDLTR